MPNVVMLGTGLIGRFYTETLHGLRSRDRVDCVYSRSADRAAAFAKTWGIPHATDDMARAVNHPGAEIVVVGLPNHLHEAAVAAAANAGRSVLCTKPLARSGEEARRSSTSSSGRACSTAISRISCTRRRR